MFASYFDGDVRDTTTDARPLLADATVHAAADSDETDEAVALRVGDIVRLPSRDESIVERTPLPAANETGVQTASRSARIRST